MKKRLAATLLAVTLTASMIAGCGSSDKPAETSADKGQSQPRQQRMQKKQVEKQRMQAPIRKRNLRSGHGTRHLTARHWKKRITFMTGRKLIS